MDILDFVIQIFPKEILQYIIIYGISYFLLIFYGTNQWKEYSSYEKVVFPFIMGGVVWIFLIYPISFFLNILRYFDNEIIKIELIDLVPYAAKIFFAILLYLLIYKLLISDKPLKDNNTFFNISKIFIKIIILLFVLGYYVLFVVFYFSEYQEIFQLIKGSLIFSLSLISIFYLIFLESYGELPKFDDLVLYLRSNFQELKSMLFSNKSKIVRIAVGIILITAVLTFTGKYLTEPTTQIVEEKIVWLVIGEMHIRSYYWQEVNISGDYYIKQNYSIKSGLIPWTKIRPNITLRDRVDNPTNPNYNFASGYLLINNSRFNTTYVTLDGRETDNNVPKFYTLEIKDLNDTIQRWDIEFNNTYSYPIEIYYVNVYQRDGLKYIKYDQSDGLSLKEIVMENSHTTIKRVTIRPESETINPNRSITLYFEKYSK